MYPGFYESYIQWEQKGKEAMLKVTLSPGNRRSIERENPMSEKKLWQNLLSLEPAKRSDFMRKISLGYDEFQAIYRKDIIESMRAAAIPPEERTEEHRTKIKRIFQW